MYTQTQIMRYGPSYVGKELLNTHTLALKNTHTKRYRPIYICIHIRMYIRTKRREIMHWKMECEQATRRSTGERFHIKCYGLTNEWTNDWTKRMNEVTTQKRQSEKEIDVIGTMLRDIWSRDQCSCIAFPFKCVGKVLFALRNLENLCKFDRFNFFLQ